MPLLCVHHTLLHRTLCPSVRLPPLSHRHFSAPFLAAFDSWAHLCLLKPSCCLSFHGRTLWFSAPLSSLRLSVLSETTVFLRVLFFLLGLSCRRSPHGDRSSDLRRQPSPPGFRPSPPGSTGQLHLKVCGGCHGLHTLKFSSSSPPTRPPHGLPTYTLLPGVPILVTGTTSHRAAQTPTPTLHPMQHPTAGGSQLCPLKSAPHHHPTACP